MQVFQCHYREGSLVSGLYFDHIKDVLNAASQGTSGFSCKPPPCVNPQNPPGTRHSFALFFACVCLFFCWIPRRGKRLSGLLVGAHLLIWFQAAGDGNPIHERTTNTGDKRSSVIKRRVKSMIISQGALGISQREALIKS